MTPTERKRSYTSTRAALSDDDRLASYLSRRPGWPFHRRTTPLAAPA